MLDGVLSTFKNNTSCIKYNGRKIVKALGENTEIKSQQKNLPTI